MRAPDHTLEPGAEKPSTATRYRPEIDGLRALAVVAVIIHHFNKNLLPGGFLGVDIFFVISGYVITASLATRTSKDFKDFIGGFYERRIKRLVPALSVFVAIMGLAICLFNPRPGPSLQTGIASLFGLSNLELIKQSTDYFAASTELNVFTHTWSLGVEEQFYLLFPFLIWCSGFGRQTKNGAKNLLLAVGILAAISLASFLGLYQINPSAAYFLMPSRFWEMAAGCLILIGFQKRACIERQLATAPPLLVTALLIGVMYLPRAWGALATVAVVALASILIACLKEGTTAFRLFTNKRVVAIGLISYSLYLWHWGVLSISRWTIGIHWWSVPIQVALMLALAAASYRWIETPLRHGQWLGRRWTTLLLGGGMLAATSGGLAALAHPMQGKLYLGKELAVKREKFQFARGRQCIPRNSDLIYCFTADNKSTRTLWVLGDSHATTLVKAARKVGQDLHMNVRLLEAPGALFPPVIKYRKADRKSDLEKLENFKFLQAELEKQMRPGDVILLMQRLPYHFGGTYYEYPSSDFVFLRSNGQPGSQQDYFQDWQAAVLQLAATAKARQANVILQTPTPEWQEETEGICSKYNFQWFNLLSRKNCEIKSAFFKDEKTGKYRHLFAALQRLPARHSSLHLFDTYSLVCPGDTCQYTMNGQDIYRDDDHLSRDYAEQHLAPQLRAFIQSIQTTAKPPPA